MTGDALFHAHRLANLPSRAMGGQLPSSTHRLHPTACRLPSTQARRERKPMSTTATETTSLIAFTLPSNPYSVQMARFYVRAVLNYHDLGDYCQDAEMVTSELVTNAITHADGATIGLEVIRLEASGAISVIVADASPDPPVMRSPTTGLEHWRGLHVVESLSASWGWTPQGKGKVVYAILTRKA